MPADFTPEDVHEVYRAELPGDEPPLVSEVTGTDPATHIYLGAPDIRSRLRVAIAGYEVHRERAGDPDIDPDASWWYAAWGEVLVPVLKELIEEQGHAH